MTQPTPASEFTLELSRVISAEPSVVFDAWTKPEMTKQWLKPSPEFRHGEFIIDPRKRGEYTIEFISPEETQHIVAGTYTRFDPPHGLSFTWTWQDGNPDHLGVKTIVHIDLQAVPSGTEIVLRHEGHSDEEMKQSHGHGWTGALEQLVARYS